MAKKTATKTETVAPAPVTEPVKEVVEETPVEESVVSPLAELSGKISAFASLVKETQAALKVLTKEYDRMKKMVEKTERKRANARTSPSGFAKPTKISDEMCAFLGVDKGTEMSRTEVTRRINAYVKANNLNDPANKRIIKPDPKLKKVLATKDDDVISYFSLQRHIKIHFLK
jgi:chromatin remodeling complex protein RSC6